MSDNGHSDDHVEVEIHLPAELAERVVAEALATGREPGDVIADIVRVFLAKLRRGRSDN